MKYSTVEIRPQACEPGKWSVTFSDLQYDRVEGDGFLSSLGFFHYPRRIGKKAAFEKLKAHLISKHQEEVDRLLRTIESLRRIEMPNTCKQWCAVPSNRQLERPVMVRSKR